MKYSRGYFYHPVVTPQPKPKNDTACALTLIAMIAVMVFVVGLRWVA